MNLSYIRRPKPVWQPIADALRGRAADAAAAAADAERAAEAERRSTEQTLEDWGIPLEPGTSRLGRAGYEGPTWALVVAAVVGALLVVFLVCVLLIFLTAVVGGVLFVIVWLLANGVVTPDGIATMIQSFFPFHGR